MLLKLQLNKTPFCYFPPCCFSVLLSSSCIVLVSHRSVLFRQQYFRSFRVQKSSRKSLKSKKHLLKSFSCYWYTFNRFNLVIKVYYSDILLNKNRQDQLRAYYAVDADISLYIVAKLVLLKLIYIQLPLYYYITILFSSNYC